MAVRTDAELAALITNIDSIIAADGKISKAELQSLLTDFKDSKLNIGDYVPGGGGGGGSAFTLKTLTDAATIGWAFDGNPAKVSITASRAISITGVGTGVHYSTLEVIHSTSGTTITLPGDSTGVTWATGAGARTLLSFYHNGTIFVWKS